MQIGGVETPENMPRCVNNCYDLESFWKSWHASFNKWLVRLALVSCPLYKIYAYSLRLFSELMIILFRYMYIPLGGSQRKLLNVWVIFTFVALWHDLEWYSFPTFSFYHNL